MEPRPSSPGQKIMDTFYKPGTQSHRRQLEQETTREPRNPFALKRIGYDLNFSSISETSEDIDTRSRPSKLQKKASDVSEDNDHLNPVEALIKRLAAIRPMAKPFLPATTAIDECKVKKREWICGVQVLFHYPEILTPQRQVMIRVLQALKNEQICLTESPTGTGKTAALLCSALAFQRTQKQPQQIIYGVRTHTQAHQVMKELKKCPYVVRAVILGSRDQLCTNPKVRREPNIRLACRQTHQSCSKYQELRDSVDFVSKVNEPLDMEDVKGFSGCAYFGSHVLAGGADLIICPHNYVLDPAISLCKSHHRVNWEIEQRIIILDEGHHIDKLCRESGSTLVPMAKFDEMDQTLRDCKAKFEWMEFKSKRRKQVDTGSQAAYKLQKELYSLRALRGHGGCGLSRSTKDLIEQGMDVKSDSLGYSDAEELILMFSDRLLERAKKEPKMTPQHVHMCGVLEGIQKLLLVADMVKKNPECYIVHGQEELLSLHCMSPSVVFAVLESRMSSMVLASGTLSPLRGFLELGHEFKQRVQMVPPPLEALHVINANQLCVLPVDTPAPVNYDSLNKPSFILQLGTIVKQLCAVAPQGTLVFFPSSGALGEALSKWKNITLITDVEHFRRVVSEGQQAVLGAVFRGHYSEGVDFSDGNCRLVICIGVPYPPWQDAAIKDKRAYNDAAKTDLTGEAWYSLQAFRAVNQAVGRCIRHQQDYGAIVLLDRRWGNADYQQQLCAWLRPFLLRGSGAICVQEASHILDNHFATNAQREKVKKEEDAEEVPTTQENVVNGTINIGPPESSKENRNEGSTPRTNADTGNRNTEDAAAQGMSLPKE